MQSLLFLGAVFSSAYAQTTGVTCRSNFNWMNNDRQQNPCIVAAYLQKSCQTTGGNWNIPPLPDGMSYTGPTTDGANVCTCSGLVYNLLNACAACQGRTTWLAWSTFRVNCAASVTTVSQWPPDRIPVGTSIEAWAYLDPTPLDTFNVTQARALADNPESTYVAASTTSGASSATSQAPTLFITTPAASSTATSDSTGKKSNTGAIIGGIVGGVVVLAAIVGGFIFFFRRKKSSASIASIDPYVAPIVPSYSGMNSDSHFTSSSPPMTQKLYDPDDPSTFPQNQAPAAFHFTSSSGTNSASNHQPLALAQSPGGYTGAALV